MIVIERKVNVVKKCESQMGKEDCQSSIQSKEDISMVVDTVVVGFVQEDRKDNDGNLIIEIIQGLRFSNSFSSLQEQDDEKALLKAIITSKKDYESDLDKPLVSLKKEIKWKGKKRSSNSQNHFH